ncbi:MAG: cupin domain-containing protein [Candidatus Binatia bacterium]
MVLRSKSVWISAPFFVLAFIVLSCAPTPRFYLQYGTQLTQSDLERILAENPLSAGENIKVVTLGKGQSVSHHVVQIRDRELPHVHKTHDLTVVVVRGKGYLVLEQRRFDLAAGDVLFIPRDVVHYFVNAFSEPSVALAIFSPPFDGKDTIPVGKP